jgi:Bacterial Ig domain
VEVARVEFYLDSESTPRASVALAPFSWTVDTRTIPNGSHTIKAKAYDTSNNTSQTSVSVTVSNNLDTQPPTVHITAPVSPDGSWPMLYNTFTVSADATDNVSVNQVEFYVDGTLQGTDTTVPYTWAMNTLSFTNGYHTLMAKAIDSSSLSTQDSLPFTIWNIPQHYSYIRIAELAYAGWTQDAAANTLLQNSVDLVAPNSAYLSGINGVAPNTPQLIYTNVSNIYLDYLTDWLAYADAHGYNREDAFFHVSLPTTFSGAGGSSRPVTNF